MDPEKPIKGPWVDGSAYGKYVRDGQDHFTRVHRSWSIFRLNASELRALLISVETNVGAGVLLTQSGPRGQADGPIEEFWSSLDQRLHNMVSSAISLVDVTRPLVAYYAKFPHNASFVAEYTERSKRVMELPVSAFLRRLRNYLLHCGTAPLAHTLHMGDPMGAEGVWDNFVIQFSSVGLLEWPDWTAPDRQYIESFDPGPPLRQLTEEYFNEMVQLHHWLAEQRQVLHVPGVPPPHLINE